MLAFWIAIALIACLRIYIEVAARPSLLPLAKRLVLGAIVALLLAAVLHADDGASTDLLIRCQKLWCWPWY